MTEYIEREAIMEFPLRKDRCDKEHANEHFIFGVESVLEYVENLPAADVVPVVHGQWIFGKDLPYSWGQIPKNKYHLYCSECLEQAFNRSEDNDPDFDVDTSYCPNCGCRMDGGADR